jgi:hypothetical protein
MKLSPDGVESDQFFCGRDEFGSQPPQCRRPERHGLGWAGAWVRGAPLTLVPVWLSVFSAFSLAADYAIARALHRCLTGRRLESI